MKSKELAEKISLILENKRAENIEVIDVGSKTSLTDYFVIATGGSTVHVKALANELEYQLKDKDAIVPLKIDDNDNGHWIVLDYSAVWVHIFSQEDREFYQLEDLWKSMTETYKQVDT